MKLIHTAIPLACGVLFGCARTDRMSATTTTSAASQDRNTITTTTTTTTTEGAAVVPEPVLYEQASTRIANVRCEHEQECDQVGRNKRYATREDCTSEQERKTRDQLTSTECPNGVDGSKLQSCLAAITHKDCSDLVFSLQGVDACKASALCLH